MSNPIINPLFSIQGALNIIVALHNGDTSLELKTSYSIQESYNRIIQLVYNATDIYNQPVYSIQESVNLWVRNLSGGSGLVLTNPFHSIQDGLNLIANYYINTLSWSSVLSTSYSIQECLNLIVRNYTYSPLSLSPALWFDAADTATLYQNSTLTTLATADADPVGGWQDKSGNARNVLQAVSSKRPTLKLAVQNGRPVVRFDGVDDILALGASPGDVQAVFFVATLDAGVERYIFELASTQSAVIKKYGAGVEYYGATPRTNMGTTTAGVCGLWGYVFANATDITTYKNAAQVATGSGSPLAIDRFDLAGSVGGGFCDMDMMEFLAFPSQLSTLGRQSLESYLNTKWAVY